MDVKAWLVPMLRGWARQWRAIDRGDSALPSLLGRIRREGEGASTTIARQRFGEVYRGDALIIARALHGAPYAVRAVVAVHYLPTGEVPVLERAKAAGLEGRDYWRALDSAYLYLAGRIDGLAERESVEPVVITAQSRH